jgi:hypothetical protein
VPSAALMHRKPNRRARWQQRRLITITAQPSIIDSQTPIAVG